MMQVSDEQTGLQDGLPIPCSFSICRSEASWYCEKCDKSFCAICNEKEHISLLPEHVGNMVNFNAQNPPFRPSQPVVCKNHSREEIITACSKCCQLMCRLCVAENSTCSDITDPDETKPHKCGALEEVSMLKKSEMLAVKKFMNDRENQIKDIYCRLDPQIKTRSDVLKKRMSAINELRVILEKYFYKDFKPIIPLRLFNDAELIILDYIQEFDKYTDDPDVERLTNRRVHLNSKIDSHLKQLLRIPPCELAGNCGAKSVSYCSECDRHMCAIHDEGHQRLHLAHLTSDYVYRNFRAVKYHKIASTKCRLHPDFKIILVCIQCCEVFCEKDSLDTNRLECQQGNAGQHVYKDMDVARDYFLSKIKNSFQILEEKRAGTNQSLNELDAAHQELLEKFSMRCHVMAAAAIHIDNFLAEEDSVCIITRFLNEYDSVRSVQQMFTNSAGQTASLENYMTDFQRRFLPSINSSPSAPMQPPPSSVEQEKTTKTLTILTTLLSPDNNKSLIVPSESVLFINYRTSGDLFFVSFNFTSKLNSIRGIDCCIPLPRPRFVTAFTLSDSFFITAAVLAASTSNVTRTMVTKKTRTLSESFSSRSETTSKNERAGNGHEDHENTIHAINDTDADSSIASSSIDVNNSTSSTSNNTADVNSHLNNNNNADLNNNNADINNDNTNVNNSATDENNNLADINDIHMGLNTEDGNEITQDFPNSMGAGPSSVNNENPHYSPTTRGQLDQSLKKGNDQSPDQEKEVSSLPATTISSESRKEAKKKIPAQSIPRKGHEEKDRPTIKVDNESTRGADQRSPNKPADILSPLSKWKYELETDSVTICNASESDSVVSVHIALNLVFVLIQKKSDECKTILAQKINTSDESMRKVLNRFVTKEKPLLLEIQGSPSGELQMASSHLSVKLAKGKRTTKQEVAMFDVLLDEDGFPEDPEVPKHLQKWRAGIRGSLQRLTILDSGAVIVLTGTPLQELIVFNEQGQHTQTIQLISKTDYPASDISVYGDELAVARFQGGVEFYQLNLILSQNTHPIDSDEEL